MSSFAVAATGGAGGAGGVGNGNVGTDGGNGSVTITPLYAGATLQITKAWGANSIAGNVARIGATTGGSANTAAFTSTAPTTASSAPVTVTAGNTITLPAEAMSTGTLANYNTVLSCTAGGGATANALSGTNGQVSNTLLIGAGDAGKAIVCTYTNTFILVPPLTRPVISCSSNGNIFNTAYNGNPAGPAKTLGLDNVWERGATFGAAQPTNWTLASVATVNPGWNAYNAFPASRFIAHQESTSHSGNVDLWYRYVFTMDPSVVVSSFRLAMDFYADNSVDAIYVNGVEQAVPGVPDGNPYLSVHYNTVNALSANLTQNWQTGTNTILVKVSSGLPALGFMARNTISAVCQSQVSLQKALGGVGRLAAADQFTVNIRTGGVSGTVVNTTTNSTTLGTGATVTAGSGNTGAYSTTAGTAYTLNEAMALGSTSSLSSYTKTLSCTNVGGTTNVSGFSSLPITFSPASGDNVACTVTNTPNTATLQLSKAWDANSIAGNVADIGATTGGSANTAAFTSTASTAASSAVVNVTVGNTITLPAEAMSTGRLANYNTVLSCTANGGPTANALSGTNGQLSNTLPIGASDTGKAIVCTYTNTLKAGAITGKVFLDNGSGAGAIANDGIANGGEAGLAGVTVKLTNCAATTFNTALTDGSGNYTLAVPSGTAVSTVLCVAQTNLGSRVSTGASVGSTAVPSPGPAVTVGTTAYTYTRTGTPDKLAFAWNGVGHASLNFGDVEPNTFAADGAKSGLAGNTVNYPHTFTAQTAGSVRFGIDSAVASPALGGWSEKVFADAGCTGTLQAGAALLWPPSAATAVSAAGQQVCIIVQEFIPATAPSGHSNTATVKADFVYTNAASALSASYTVKDVTTLSSSALDLKKEVRNETTSGAFGINNTAKSGETLEYRISYTNNGATPISALAISDTTPNFTSFVSALAGSTPATLTACAKTTPANASPAAPVACSLAQAAGGTGAIRFSFSGPLDPGATGTVLFQVKVD